MTTTMTEIAMDNRKRNAGRRQASERAPTAEPQTQSAGRTNNQVLNSLYSDLWGVHAGIDLSLNALDHVEDGEETAAIWGVLNMAKQQLRRTIDALDEFGVGLGQDVRNAAARSAE